MPLRCNAAPLLRWLMPQHRGQGCGFHLSKDRPAASFGRCAHCPTLAQGWQTRPWRLGV